MPNKADNEDYQVIGEEQKIHEIGKDSDLADHLSTSGKGQKSKKSKADNTNIVANKLKISGEAEQNAASDRHKANVTLEECRRCAIIA